MFYGDTCSIGVNSYLIEELNQYKNYPKVSIYLDKFKMVKSEINNFRKKFFTSIEKENVILLSLPRIFKNKKEWNIVNVAGIYFGADSVTNIALSYFIIKNNITKYDLSLIQIGNIDPAFKKELTIYGKDWYYSLKLKQIQSDPRN